jgi:hypothetical protein
MAKIKLTVSAAGVAGAYPGIQQAWAAIPDDVVASGNSYWIAPLNDGIYNLGTAPVVLAAKTTDAVHNITIEPEPGHAFYQNPNFLTGPYALTDANGVTLRGTGNYYNMITVMADYTRIAGLQIDHAGGGNNGAAVFFDSAASNSSIDLSIVKFKPSGNYAVALQSSGGGFKVRNTLIQLVGAASQGIYFGHLEAVAENVTITRPPSFARPPSAAGIELWADGATLRNILVINSPFKRGSGNPNVAEYNGSDGTISFGTNNLQNLVATDLFNDPATDYRTKAGAAIINAGGAPLDTSSKAPSGSRQMGLGADIGAWEFPEAVQAPSATITSVTVTGTTVTVQGTTTGNPDRGVASIVHANTAYNDSAVDQGPANLVLTQGAFSIVFNGMKVGDYGLAISVGNDAYPSVDVSNASAYPVTIVDAVATSVVQDPMDGEVLHIHGTYTGNATSASLVIPALASDPQGALDVVGTVTLANGVFSSTIDLPPGNYDEGVLRFTTANGTSRPQSGTSPVSVIGIYGTPQAEQGTPDTTPPVMAGTITFSAITDTSFTMGWQAATDDTGIARYEYSLDGVTFTAIGASLSRAVTGRAPQTAYTVSLRAVDFGGNISNLLTGNVTTIAAAPVATPKTVTVLLDNGDLTPAASLSGLRWAWFDQVTPNLFAAPTDKGTAESTDANGQLVITLPNSQLPTGGIGWLVITDSAGNPAAAHNAFSGPVAVG